MPRRNKLLRHNLLIICEGTSTEPQYFASLKPIAQKAWSETHQLFLEIKPKPFIEEATDKSISSHKSPRKKRQLKKTKEKFTPEIYRPDDQYKAVPVRYVKEAQEGLEDGIYEAAWAVFDKDYHPKHQEAFELAKEKISGNTVKIAFSSISFEHWLLLHFEKNATAFEKSECKENKLSIDCGTGVHPKDCSGQKCVNGHLRKTQYLSKIAKNVTAEFYTNEIQPYYWRALENAAWLKYLSLKANPTIPTYARNPYTTMDDLFKYLLNIPQNIIWLGFNETKKIDNLTITFLSLSSTSIRLILKNGTNLTYLFLPKSIFMSDEKKEYPINCEKLLLPSGVSKNIDLDISNYSQLQFNFCPMTSSNFRIMLFK